MINKQLIQLITLLTILLFFGACNNDPYEDLPPEIRKEAEKLTAEQIQKVDLIAEGKAISELEANKKGFGFNYIVWIFVTKDYEALFSEFPKHRDYPSQQATIEKMTTKEVKRGEPIYLVAFVTNPTTGSVLTADITVKRPDGVAYTSNKGVKLWNNKATAQHRYEPSDYVLKMQFNSGDQTGEYNVEIDVTDSVSNLKMSLQYPITLS